MDTDDTPPPDITEAPRDWIEYADGLQGDEDGIEGDEDE